VYAQLLKSAYPYGLYVYAGLQVGYYM